MDSTLGQIPGGHCCQRCHHSCNLHNLSSPPPYVEASNTEPLSSERHEPEGEDALNRQTERLKPALTWREKKQSHETREDPTAGPKNSFLASTMQTAKLLERLSAVRNKSKRASDLTSSLFNRHEQLSAPIKASLPEFMKKLDRERKSSWEKKERSDESPKKKRYVFPIIPERQLHWHIYIMSQTPDYKTADMVGLKLFCVRELPRWMFPNSFLGEHLYWYKGDDEAILKGENCRIHDTDKCFCVEFYEGAVSMKNVTFDLVTGVGFDKVRANSLVKKCLIHKSLECYCWMVFNGGKWWHLDMKSKTKMLHKWANEQEAKGKMKFGPKRSLKRGRLYRR